jgi:hypothetical protein
MTVPKKSNRPKSNMGDIIKGFGLAGGAAAAVGGYGAGKLHKRVTSKAKKLTEGLAKGGTKMILKDALGANMTSQESYLLKKKKKK